MMAIQEFGDKATHFACLPHGIEGAEVIDPVVFGDRSYELCTGSCDADAKWGLAATVVGLRELVCPSAVPGLVVAVAVNAVEGVRRRWSRPHVGEEVDEQRPSLAHLDSAPAVVSVGVESLVAAPRFHYAPDAVLGAARHSVSRQPFAATFANQAAAASRFAEG